jgi:CRISPR-associated protein (TIGR03984 family)
MSAELFIHTRQGLSLADALSAWAEVSGADRATAILYSPDRCELATLTAGSLQTFDGLPVDITRVFEARVFHETAELRWLDDPSVEPSRKAVILTETAIQLDGWQSSHPIKIRKKLDQDYLLGGRGTGRPTTNGWSEIADAHAGVLHVPLTDVRKNQRVRLCSVEYVIEADHGNAVIFDERLVRLEVARG